MTMKLAMLAIGAALALSVPAIGAPLPVEVPSVAAPAIGLAQHAYKSRGFRSCMRGKYGPRYFARVPRAVRWHMAQACMA
jgi:hypothetical protein